MARTSQLSQGSQAFYKKISVLSQDSSLGQIQMEILENLTPDYTSEYRGGTEACRRNMSDLF